MTTSPENLEPAAAELWNEPADTILVGMWNGESAPGSVPKTSRFRVLADGRLRLQSHSVWVSTRASVEESYGPLTVELSRPKKGARRLGTN